MAPAQPIWVHLAAFALSIVVPLWGLLGYVAWSSVEQARRENQQQTILVARNLALELDSELAGFGGILRALATSPALQDGDFGRFHEQAAQVAPAGGAIVLRDRSGQQLVNTLFPFGTPLPVTTAAAVLAADACVFRTRASCVSDLYIGTTDRQPYVLLDAPVQRGEEVVFALNIAVRARYLADLLEAHRLPPGWGVSILDRSDHIVARSPDHDRFVGNRANAALRADVAADEGTVRSVNVAGVPVWGAYVRLPAWGWRVAIGVPESVLNAPLWRSGLSLSLGGLLAVGASVAGALLYGRRLARPIRALGRAAAEMGAGPAVGRTMIRELDQVALSLASSEERLRLAQAAGRIGTWELLDPATGRTAVSVSQAGLYGLPAETAPHGFGWDAWLARIHPEDRARVEAASRAAITSGRPYKEEFRILRADTGAERWIRASAQWSSEDAGGGRRFVGVDIDITDAKCAEASLAASEAEYRAIFENSVVGKAQADPATLRIMRANRHLCAIVGYGEQKLLGGMTILDLIHPDDRAAIQRGVRSATAADRPFHLEARMLRSDGAERWVIGSVVLLPRAAGRQAAIVATVQDITERRRAEERQAMLAREVDHRAKNVLAVVQAALRLTPRSDANAFARAVEGRVNALARTQTLLAEGQWSGAPLRRLIAGELAGFVASGAGGEQPCARLAGPPMLITTDAAQPLAMALHELATNATKYGALSVAGGIVSVTWWADTAAGALRLDWVETGGPAVPGPPDRRGFGSRVLESMLSQLGGSATLDWHPGGLACRLSAPLSGAVAHLPARSPATAV